MEKIELVLGTKEYIRIPVYATKAGVDYDPTDNTVEFGFCDASDAEHHPTLTWYAGSWETVDGIHYAKFLVGVGYVPTAGTYAAYVQITDNPEVPVKFAGLLEVS